MKDDIEKLKQEHAHLSIISQIAVQMLSLNTLDQVLWFLAQDVVSKLGFDDVVIYTFDKDQQKLIQGAAFGSKSDDNKRIIAPKTLSLGEGVVGKAALDKSPIIVNDTRMSDYYVVDNISRLSEIAVPMVIDNQLVGVIDSENKATDFYTQQHLETLKAIALIAGTKIVKTLSSTELQKSLEKLEYSSRIQDALFDIAELIFETETMDEFYHRLHQEISKLIYAKNFMIALITPDKKGIEFPFCIDEVDGYADVSVVPFDREKPSVTGYVMNTQKPLMVTDKQLNKMVNDKKVFVYGSVPKCWLGVPLINKSEFEGALIVQNYFDDYIFDENDKQLLVFAAKHITNAIERMQAREELKFQALHDSLTQLPNRLLFNDRTKQAIRNINRNTHHLVAVMFLDLDKFKLVNDTYGHQIGDQLLIEVSIAINQCLRNSDTLCRLSGDEFAILMEDLTSKEQAIKIADRIIKQVQLPILIDDKTITTSTSIGVAIYDPKYSAEELIKYADQAMYIAKSSGRNQYCLFDATHVQLSKNEHYEQELKTAIKHGQFELEFQPLIDFNSLEIIGAEAFVRWHHPVKGLILPNEFLKSAKKFGLVAQVDTIVIEKVIAFLKQCKDLIPNRFVFGINMAGPSLHSEQVMGVIASHYQQNPHLLNHLCFEITEQFYVENFDKVKKHINQLRAMDAKISLDDFGTGYSSLNYLDKFSFDSIKIDQSFIGYLAPDKETSIILTTIINLAKSLDINIVAEGIETEYQFQTMQSLTCDVAQGFYIAKPMNKEMIIQLIKDKSKMKDIIRQQFK